MPFLVDGNVLSEATRPDPDEKVVRWLRANEEELVVDPIILGELHAGILFLPKGRRRRNLESWFREVTDSIHCLDWNAQTALFWSQLLADLRANGRNMPLKDSLIAASALAHDLTLATRNEKDFLHCGVRLLNPFAV
jgi:predicted nucleic acid-binding protein